MEAALLTIKQIPTLLLMPLLPERYRKMWPWEPAIPTAALVYMNALAHAAGCALIWMLAFTSYQKGFGDMVAERIADPNGTGEVPTVDFMGGEVTTLNWLGIFGFFAFFFTLKGLLSWAYVIDSVLRCAKAATETNYSGSVFLSAPLWLIDFCRGKMEQARMDKLYGRAEVPDRITEIGENLLVRSNRPHPEWHGLLAFRFDDKLYRLDIGKEGVEGTKRCFEYRFVPWPEQEMIRHIVVLGNREDQ